MVFQGSSAAISHTGKVRSNNQDSGYSGSNLFVVADGMGGHAGGDVASSLAVARLERVDRPFESTSAAERALRDAIADAATELIDTVHVRPELAGMGTTVSALVMVDDYAVIAHIGDSRIYLFRDGALTQITTDHTFVQRLVDSGRITPEEARYHPRRSVLMRVLGDMDPDPELDTFIMPTQPGDRWLLCSDGLSGVVDDPHTAKALGLGPRSRPHRRQPAQAGARRRRARQRHDRPRRRRRTASDLLGHAHHRRIRVEPGRHRGAGGTARPHQLAAPEPAGGERADALRARRGVPRGAHRGGPPPRAPPARRLDRRPRPGARAHRRRPCTAATSGPRRATSSAPTRTPS